MGIYMADLEKGDLIFQHVANANLESTFVCHAAVVAQQVVRLKPLIFDIANPAGFCKRPLSSSPAPFWSAYRVSDLLLAAKAALIGNYWISNCPRVVYSTKKNRLTSHGAFSILSMATAFAGRSYFGTHSMAYANYLCTQCLTTLPREIHPDNTSLFSGEVCTYLPIALYQAASGAEVVKYMALDARKSISRDLVKYLNKNPEWRFLGTLDMTRPEM
ncbi:hypothetical protein V5J34_000312 [Endozoicomonas sp. NE35]